MEIQLARSAVGGQRTRKQPDLISPVVDSCVGGGNSFERHFYSWIVHPHRCDDDVEKVFYFFSVVAKMV